MKWLVCSHIVYDVYVRKEDVKICIYALPDGGGGIQGITSGIVVHGVQ